MKKQLVALLLLSSGCLVTVNVLLVFLTVAWVGLLFVIVVFPDHTHLLFQTLQVHMSHDVEGTGLHRGWLLSQGQG